MIFDCAPELNRQHLLFIDRARVRPLEKPWRSARATARDLRQQMIDIITRLANAA